MTEQETHNVVDQENYSFVIPLEPQSAERPRSSFKTKTVTSSRKYADWRRKFDAWFEVFLETTNYDLVRYMLGHNKTVRTVSGNPRDENGKLRGSLQPTFNGYKMTVYFFSERPTNVKASDRPWNVSTPDVDNLFKAVSDGIFGHRVMYDAGLNDSFVVHQEVAKLYAKDGEEPHIYVEFERIGG
jgi:Holliday junction resolvase